MSILYEDRPSDSTYIETVMRGWTASDGTPVRPAESHWHMVLSKHDGKEEFLVVGPWTAAGIVSYTEGAEILWIQFKLGVFMPYLPTSKLRNREMILPRAGSRSFWLNGSAWQDPDYDNADTFVDRLAREEVLVFDPVVNAAQQGKTQKVAPRTVRHRFLRATGLTQSHIYQIERAQRAAALLEQGVSILDTVYQADYYDQPHLTRSLKQWVGYTPAQMIQLSSP